MAHSRASHLSRKSYEYPIPRDSSGNKNAPSAISSQALLSPEIWIKHNWKETSSEKFEIMINLSQHEAMNPMHFYDQSYPRQWRPRDPTTQLGSNHNEWIVRQLFNGRSWQIRWGVELLNSQGALSKTYTNHLHIVWALTLPHATVHLSFVTAATAYWVDTVDVNYNTCIWNMEEHGYHS